MILIKFRVSRWKLAILFSLILAGCGSSRSEPRGANCFPEQTRRWIYEASAEPKLEQTAAEATATVYVDRSGSMVGYIKGATSVDSPLVNLLGTMPTILSSMARKVSYRAFGESLTGPIADGANVTNKSEFFNCANCDNDDSRLNLALDRIAANPNEMGILISDLWFKNSEISTTGIAALKVPLAQILESGRMISIYGFDAPFDGNIYDLPTATPNVVQTKPYTGRHPLYLLVVGTKEQNLAFQDALKKAPVEKIGRGADGISRVHFTVNPGPLTPRSKAPLTSGNHPNLRTANFASYDGLIIQQFELDGSISSALTRKQWVPPTWKSPKPEDFIPNTVHEGDLVPSLYYWKQNNKQCNKSSWSPSNKIEAVWKKDTVSQILEINPKVLSGKFARDGIYLVSGQLDRQSIQRDSTATAWMRAWSLDPEAAVAGAREGSDRFPTLNLDEFARLMEDTLDDVAKKKQGGIIGFSILVKVGD
jgi:hypothetical protein